MGYYELSGMRSTSFTYFNNVSGAPIYINNTWYGVAGAEYTRFGTRASYSGGVYYTISQYFIGSTVAINQVTRSDSIFLTVDGVRIGGALIRTSDTGGTAGVEMQGRFRAGSQVVGYAFQNATYENVTFSINGVTYDGIGSIGGGSTNIYRKENGVIISTPYIVLGAFVPEFANAIVDFGDNPQTVYSNVRRFFVENYTEVYPYTYTVYDNRGSTIKDVGAELPSVTAVTVQSVGAQRTATLTGSNGTLYPLTWESPTPENQVFLGLSTQRGARRASLANGQSTAVTFNSDTSLYEVFGTYRPPATEFYISLYRNNAEGNKVDKSSSLISVSTLGGALRAECDIVNPTIIINRASASDFNYVYIPSFGRYYFVDSVISVRKNTWEIKLKVDVLMSYKNEILSQTAIISRQENNYNDFLVDAQIPTAKNPNVEIIEIPNTIINTRTATGNEHNFILTTIGA